MTMSSLPSWIPTQLLLGGEWVDGSGGSFVVNDPSTEAPLATVQRAGVADVRKAIDLAAEAQPKWAARAPRERAEVLRAVFEAMIERRDDLATVMMLENGKSMTDALGEVAYAAEFFRWFSEETVRIGGELRTAPSGANRIVTFRKPVGLAYLITPWNFPAAMATRKIAPALAAGCGFLLKPAEETPLTALAVGQLLLDAGVEPGIVSVLPTDRPAEMTDVVMADARVGKISFTGSTQVGRILLRQSADRVLNASMELGGNGPFIVCEDADLDAALEGALIAKMRNGGQACTAVNRFLVHDAVYDEFVARLSEAMGQWEIRPVINRVAVDRIAGAVDEALSAGARRVLGEGSVPTPGCFYPATVLADVPSDARILRDEIFGPVAVCVRVKSDDDAIGIANSSDYGLASYIYTRDLARGLRLSEALEVGMVGLNRGLISDPAAPFGGVKQSGLGREGGFDGIDEFLETTYVSVNWEG